MSVKISQKRLVYTDVELTDSETLEVIKKYITEVLLGDGVYIKDGKLEHWTSWPHGSGTTTDMGEPTEVQKTAWAFLKALGEQS